MKEINQSNHSKIKNMSNLSTHIPFVKQNDESYFEAGTLGLYVDNDGSLMCGPKGMSTSLVEGLRLG